MKKYLLIFISAMLLWNCEQTELLDETGRLEITDFSLPMLPEGYNYQGWLLVGGTYVSVGTFNIDSINNNRARFSNIETSDLALAEAFAITVENASSPAPSNFVLLVGDFDGNSAELATNKTTSNGITSLGNKISASYTIQNATIPVDQTGNDTPNGIWFFKGSGTQTESTISLEYGELRYQAWLSTILDNAPKYVNMGIITSDSIRDLSNIYTSYNTNVPDFAGEDFLVLPSGESFPEGFFPRNVTLPGTKVIITPIITGYASHTVPFPIFLLEGTIPVGVANDPNITYNMELNTVYKAKATKL